MKTLKNIAIFISSSILFTTQSYADIWGDIGGAVTRPIRPIIRPEPVRENNRSVGFAVKNKSNSIVYAAVGYYVSGSSGGELPMMRPGYWYASGYQRINPGENKFIYSGKPGTIYSSIYVNLSNNNGELTPANYISKSQFCVKSSDSFKSQEYDDRSFQLNSKTGRNCSDVGGIGATFYKMESVTDFTVN